MARKTPTPPPRPAGPPRRRPNLAVRSREYLTAEEVDLLRRAAERTGRNGHRDATMIYVGYRHALRVTELVGWKWDVIDLQARTAWVVRVKGSKSTMHTLEPDEVAALKKLAPNPRDRVGHVFRTDRGGPMSESGFFKVVARAGSLAGIPFPVHPHMLRHGCGFEMTRAGVPTRMVQDWLGHKNIQHTVRYTELDPGRFKAGKAGMWGQILGRKPAARDDDRGDD